MTQELSYKAKHDALTGLYNRLEFQIQLKYILEGSRDKNIQHALLYMDLDRFKIVNDTCGHEAGDQLLKDVALILQEIVNRHTSFTQATLANSLCKGIENLRFFWQNEEQEKRVFSIGISIGLVAISVLMDNPKSIIAMADTACYAAKNAGRNGVHIYQEDNEMPSAHNIQWVSMINDNLEKDSGFYLFYQSITPLTSHNDVNDCYEILLRMNDQQEHLSTQPQHLDNLTLITINISGYSLNDSLFLETIINYLEESEISTHKFCFEIAETTVLNNLTGVLDFVIALKKLGCRFALDNFGTGIASFAYLKYLPVDFLKIDGSLIKNIISDPVDYAMVKSINDIAHLMQIQTIAESVENQATLDKLKEIQVDYVQGYWIAEPKPL